MTYWEEARTFEAKCDNICSLLSAIQTRAGQITDVLLRLDCRFSTKIEKMKNVIDNSGNTILVEYPEYYGVTLTLEGNIIEKEDGYFAEGTVELKANSEMEVYTKYAQPKMKVTSIDI